MRALAARLWRMLRSALPSTRGVSSDYVALDRSEAGAEGSRLRDSWKNESLPDRQRALVEGQLQRYRAGGDVDVFDVLVRALRDLRVDLAGRALLEIGCSSGYYAEVLQIAGLGLKYSGCDYAPAFVAMAREKYPGIDVSVADATALPYPDEAFDVVVSGCCLLHIPDYPAAVAETARVTRGFAMFHRTAVVFGQEERWFRKQAYGVETVEIHFNEEAFLALLARHGLELLATYTLHETADDPGGTRGAAVRTYVCRKIPR